MDSKTAIQEFKDYIDERLKHFTKQARYEGNILEARYANEICARTVLDIIEHQMFTNLIASLPNESNDKADGWIKHEGDDLKRNLEQENAELREALEKLHYELDYLTGDFWTEETQDQAWRLRHITSNALNKES